ncbi:capsid maturation protease [Arthrobacter phage Suppi]|uniref:Capsid maturation protease n=4 Tax=Korravirus TaxID=1982076 RepID=A0A1D8ESL1_9CAUD|nr:head maturation protease [Arthrobacter phage Wayne]YP_010050176.1 head maturation protease [Arthrobacter phage Litotes]AOT24035.1 capsid maturation protease [Arthrobacter phage Suppi]ASR83243.1 capsid maturation protease [Arthrobacter phage Canowicakte]ALY10732.1 capsid maturation protease [Arthrobacter phage Wayne]AZS08728.1 capsid maturation protease [Arthrobacter phage Litotes]
MKMKDARIRVKAGPDDGLKEGQFEAYASVFGNKDSYGDVVMPGAFDESIANWKDSGNALPLLFGHNMSDPDYNIGHVESAKEDDHGLLTLNQLDLDSPKAAQVYRLIKGRRINQMSFAYDVLEGGWAKRQKDPEGGDGEDNLEEIFELRKLKLYEVSVVPIGANQETEITAVKAAALAEQQLREGTLSKSAFDALLKTYHNIGEILMGGARTLPDAASEKGQGKTEEPETAKVEDPRPKSSASARSLAAELQLLALKGEI